MPHPFARGAYELRVAAAIAAARHAAGLGHPGLVGEAREIFVRELLRPLLPPTFAFGTGKIIDSAGGESDQIDVVVYDRSVMPPLLLSDTTDIGLFPVEACTYAIEVKSAATATTWGDAASKGASVLRLQQLPDIYGAPRKFRTVPALFAFDTDLASAPSAAAELTRWKKYVPSAAASPGFIDVPVVCIAGMGYGVHWGLPKPYDWFVAPGDNSEVIGWITGVVNTLFETVGQPPSKFGNYLWP